MTREKMATQNVLQFIFYALAKVRHPQKKEFYKSSLRIKFQQPVKEIPDKFTWSILRQDEQMVTTNR